MPVEMRMWRIDGDEPHPLTSAVLPAEKDLHQFLALDPSLLGERLLVIGSEVLTPYGKRLDLLAIDGDGNLHVLELKRDKTPREVVAQVLDYGSWVSTLSRDDVIDLANKHLDQAFEVAFEKVFGSPPPDELNGELNLTIVAAELDSSSERIVTYLRGFGVPVNAVFFSYLEDEERRYLARSWLVDDHVVSAAPGAKKGKRAQWNGQDWYVNFGTHGREWEDGRNLGFVSAGGSARSSGTLRTIPVGDRVNVYIPGSGYVGVGVTLAEAKRFDAALVRQDGNWVPLAPQTLGGSYRHVQPGQVETDEISEWVLPVRWLAAVPLADAYAEPGMFYNPNTSCKLRQEFTLERLADHFGLDKDGE
jgi:hypothetical protein